MFSYPSVLTYGLRAQKNRFNETVQHMFWLRNKKKIILVHTLNLIKTTTLVCRFDKYIYKMATMEAAVRHMDKSPNEIQLLCHYGSYDAS